MYHSICYCGTMWASSPTFLSHAILRKKKHFLVDRFIFSQDNVAEAKLYKYTASRKPRSIGEKETIYSPALKL